MQELAGEAGFRSLTLQISNLSGAALVKQKKSWRSSGVEVVTSVACWQSLACIDSSEPHPLIAKPGFTSRTATKLNTDFSMFFKVVLQVVCLQSIKLLRVASPKTVAARRHTSFAVASVLRAEDDESEVDLPRSALKVETMRASGAVAIMKHDMLLSTFVFAGLIWLVYQKKW